MAKIWGANTLEIQYGETMTPRMVNFFHLLHFTIGHMMSFFYAKFVIFWGIKLLGNIWGLLGFPIFRPPFIKITPMKSSHMTFLFTMWLFFMYLFTLGLHTWGVPCIKAKTNGLGSFHVCLSAVHSYCHTQHDRPSSIARVQHAAHRLLRQHKQPVIINHHSVSRPALRTRGLHYVAHVHCIHQHNTQ